VYVICVITINGGLFRIHVLNMPLVRFSKRNYIGMRRVCKIAGPNNL